VETLKVVMTGNGELIPLVPHILQLGNIFSRYLLRDVMD